MNEQTVRVGMLVIGKVCMALIVGEALGGVVSRPIAAWRIKQNVNVENIASLMDVQNQRICDLEEKVFGKSK